MHFCYEVSKFFFSSMQFLKIHFHVFFLIIQTFVGVYSQTRILFLPFFHNFFIEINFAFSFLIVIMFSFSFDCSIFRKVVTQQRMKNLKQMNVDLVLSLLTLINYLKSIMHKSKHLHASTKVKINHLTFLSHCAKKWKYKIQV